MAYRGTNDFLSATPIIGFKQAGTLTIPDLSGYPGIAQVQGITYNLTNYFINKNNAIFKFSSSGTLLASNTSPFSAGLVQNVLEDGDWNETNNTLIIPAMTNNAPYWNNLTFNVYDTSLNLLASYGVSNNFFSGCSSLVVDNARGKIFAVDAYDGTNLYVFSIPTPDAPPTFLGKLAYSEPLPISAGGPTPIAGICEKNGVLYLAADNGASVNIYTIDPDTGNKNWLTIYSAGASEHEGLDFNGSYLLQCLAGPSFAPVQYSPVYISSTADIAAKSYPLDDWLIGDFDFSTTANAVTFDKSRTAARLYANYYDTLSASFPPQVSTPWGFGLNCGPSGTVCDYDRSDFLRLTNFTLAFEFNTTTAGVSPSSPFVSKFNSGFAGQFAVSSSATNILQFYVVNSNNTARVILSATNATSFADGNWHEVIATFAGGNYSPSNQCLYLDGNLLGYTANSSGTVGTNYPCHFRIGGSDLTVISTACSYDEVKIWNRAFNAAEANNYYKSMYFPVSGSGGGTNAYTNNPAISGAGVISGSGIGTSISPTQIVAAGLITNGMTGVTLNNVTLSNVFGLGTMALADTNDYVPSAALGVTVVTNNQTTLVLSNSAGPKTILATTASGFAMQSQGAGGNVSLTGSTNNTWNFGIGSAVTAGSFIGDGSTLTNLNASQLTSGTVPDARLSSHVVVITNTPTDGDVAVATGPNWKSQAPSGGGGVTTSIAYQYDGSVTIGTAASPLIVPSGGIGSGSIVTFLLPPGTYTNFAAGISQCGSSVGIGSGTNITFICCTNASNTTFPQTALVTSLAGPTAYKSMTISSNVVNSFTLTTWGNFSVMATNNTGGTLPSTVVHLSLSRINQ